MGVTHLGRQLPIGFRQAFNLQPLPLDRRRLRAAICWRRPAPPRAAGRAARRCWAGEGSWQRAEQLRGPPDHLAGDACRVLGLSRVHGQGTWWRRLQLTQRLCTPTHKPPLPPRMWPAQRPPTHKPPPPAPRPRPLTCGLHHIHQHLHSFQAAPALLLAAHQLLLEAVHLHAQLLAGCLVLPRPPGRLHQQQVQHQS
jgi:hypothetical protein